MKSLKIENLSFKYPDAEQYALKDVSLEIQGGELCVIIGATGSGKSTLLRCLKPEIAPRGEVHGKVTLDGADVTTLDTRSSAMSIGFVAQSPEQSIVTDKVYHEIAFGLESIGVEQAQMHRRVSEVCAYFGIEELFERGTDTLSGGQKQLLCLAGAVAMAPDVLLLDEPSSQLDPIAAAELINAVKRLNSDLGMTVIMVEHRLEDIISVCDRLVVLEDGHLTHQGKPRRVISELAERSSRPTVIDALPTPTRIYLENRKLYADADVPLSVKELRTLIMLTGKTPAPSFRALPPKSSDETTVELTDISFRYGKNLPDVIKNLSLRAHRGEVLCILGGNGSGKSTLLSLIAGIETPHSGKIRLLGKRQKDFHDADLWRGTVAYLPQDVEVLFTKQTVKEELGPSPWGARLGLTPLSGMHPYDLSGGQKQLLGLAMVLATDPKILLMDEPTKGLDPEKRALMSDVIASLSESGVTTVIVSHDVEFCARIAHTATLFFRGTALPPAVPDEFFKGNRFYTTAERKVLAFSEKKPKQ
ncbi:MAG: energy-coupling factor ABC transporter ATP-binding protein [Clostridia bacterium]|nr:energy-coupling factor ABC transporter ATP-binding protein [Clostridia bacterium]